MAVRQKTKGLWFGFALLIVFSVTRKASADQRVENSVGNAGAGIVGDCLVRVRVVSGSERFQTAAAENVEVSSFLRDVRAQLKPLPYAKYRPIAHDEKTIRLEERGLFQVTTPEGEVHTLAVVPHTVADHRVHMTVDWRGPGAERLLFAKVRVSNGQNIVVGAENSRDSSTIMCIKVKCH